MTRDIEREYIVMSENEWELDTTFCWTADEIFSADKDTGLIGTRLGFDCYVAHLIPHTS